MRVYNCSAYEQQDSCGMPYQVYNRVTLKVSRSLRPWSTLKALFRIKVFLVISAFVNFAVGDPAVQAHYLIYIETSYTALQSDALTNLITAHYSCGASHGVVNMRIRPGELWHPLQFRSNSSKVILRAQIQFPKADNSFCMGAVALFVKSRLSCPNFTMLYSKHTFHVHVKQQAVTILLHSSPKLAVPCLYQNHRFSDADLRTARQHIQIPNMKILWNRNNYREVIVSAMNNDKISSRLRPYFAVVIWILPITLLFFPATSVSASTRLASRAKADDADTPNKSVTHISLPVRPIQMSKIPSSAGITMLCRDQNENPPKSHSAWDMGGSISQPSPCCKRYPLYPHGTITLTNGARWQT